MCCPVITVPECFAKTTGGHIAQLPVWTDDTFTTAVTDLSGYTITAAFALTGTVTPLTALTVGNGGIVVTGGVIDLWLPPAVAAGLAVGANYTGDLKMVTPGGREFIAVGFTFDIEAGYAA